MKAIARVWIGAGLVGVAVALSGACSSDGSSEGDAGASDASSADGATSTADAAPAVDAAPANDAAVGDASVAPTFSNVYDRIVARECNSCHTTSHSTGLDMSTKALAYQNLVGKASASPGNCAGRTRVVPGDAAQSLFFTKIDHSAGCGNPMPLGKSKLDGREAKLVEAWVEAGAKDD